MHGFRQRLNALAKVQFYFFFSKGDARIKNVTLFDCTNHRVGITNVYQGSLDTLLQTVFLFK